MKSIDDKIIELCAASPVREACGLVSSNGTIYSVRNVSISTHDFIFDKSDYYGALAKMKESGTALRAIYHSHVNGNHELSASDRATMQKFKCAFILVVGSSIRWIDYE